MEGYKKRLVKELFELKDRSSKLKRILDKYDNDELDFKLPCPVDILYAQYYAMMSYLHVLIQRVDIEGIELPISVDLDKFNPNR